MNTAEIQTAIAKMSKAYEAGNKAAQREPITSPEFRGAFHIADDLGFTRNTMEWDCAVSGAIAFYEKGHAH